MIGAIQTAIQNKPITDKSVTPVEQRKDGDASGAIFSSNHDQTENLSSKTDALPDTLRNLNNSIFYIPQQSKREVALKQINVDDSVAKKRSLEIGELDRLANAAPHDKNLAFAEIICKKVREFIPLGTNTQADSHKQLLSFKEKVDIIQRLRCDVQESVNNYAILHNGNAPPTDEIYATCTVALKKYKYGQCGELAKAAFVEAQKNPNIASIHYCSSSEGKHAFIVIGDREKSGWSSNTVVCDPWAQKYYPIAEFSEMQKPENDVRYADAYYRPENIWLFSNGKAPLPYLSGKLDVQFSWRRNGEG